MLDELDALLIGEALTCRPEHELGEVKAHAVHLVTIDPEKSEQAAVARAEVEDATSVTGHMLEQDALSLCAVRELIRAAEIAMDFLLVGRPLLSGHAFHPL